MYVFFPSFSVGFFPHILFLTPSSLFFSPSLSGPVLVCAQSDGGDGEDEVEGESVSVGRRGGEEDDDDDEMEVEDEEEEDVEPVQVPDLVYRSYFYSSVWLW